MRRLPAVARFLCAVALLAACGCPAPPDPPAAARDEHSRANPNQVRSTHLNLDLEVRFDQRVLEGAVTHRIERIDPAAPLFLDTRDLDITRVETAPAPGHPFSPAPYLLGKSDPVRGAPLRIDLPAQAAAVRVHYRTRPTASGLRWIPPIHTKGQRHPFFYTQSWAIHARSWIPCQDTPAVRVTYGARIRAPRELVVLMSARRITADEPVFEMPYPIPAYLIALAAGDLVFRPLSPRSGIWAEPAAIDPAARQFAATEPIVQAAERLLGPYLWQRYDTLVLPAGFPYDGMENPMLTYVPASAVTGETSQANVIAHELAHSWSGNLVTNATWRDIWLNEGLTTYLERRIIESVYGPGRAAADAAASREVMAATLANLPERRQILHADPAGYDPQQWLSDIPYQKGALFFDALEQAFGRPAVDRFLSGYLQAFRFRSVTTLQFRDFLETHLLRGDAAAARRFPVHEWLERPGLPGPAAAWPR